MEILLAVVFVALCAVIVLLAVENRRLSRECSAALYVEHRQLLMAAAANTPKDLGILLKTADTPAPAVDRAAYEAELRANLAAMGLDPSALDATLNPDIDVDLPVLPHGL